MIGDETEKGLGKDPSRNEKVLDGFSSEAMWSAMLQEDHR